MALDNLKIEYTLQLWREGDCFIAHAMPLDVMSAGKTEEEARHALDEAVELFLKTADDIGTLEQVLEDAGYVQRDDEWEGPAWISALSV
jgi:predicted RNase H-like HicB family nuclease